MNNLSLSDKGQRLVDMYSQMAEHGYATNIGADIKDAYNSFELSKIRDVVKNKFAQYDIGTVLDYGCGGSDWNAPGFANEMSATDFLKEVRSEAKALKIDADMLKRPVNVGFSGGEKKRNEILQMAMLEPKMCILDETDSGLDVDAMKLVAEGVNALRSNDRGFLVITHYQRLLDHIKPDVVHIMADGRIVKTGGPELALEVENNGYSDILAEVA